MKKLLLLFMVFFSISVNAQKLFSKEWKDQQLGRDSASIAKKEAEQAAYQKKKSTYHIPNINIASEMEAFTIDDGLKKSGMYLKKSANYQYASLACFAAGTWLCIAACYKKEVSDRNVLLFSGGGLELIGLILHIKSIDYKFKSGRLLELTGNKVTLSF